MLDAEFSHPPEPSNLSMNSHLPPTNHNHKNHTTNNHQNNNRHHHNTHHHQKKIKVLRTISRKKKRKKIILCCAYFSIDHTETILESGTADKRCSDKLVFFVLNVKKRIFVIQNFNIAHLSVKEFFFLFFLIIKRTNVLKRVS